MTASGRVSPDPNAPDPGLGRDGLEWPEIVSVENRFNAATKKATVTSTMQAGLVAELDSAGNAVAASASTLSSVITIIGVLKSTTTGGNSGIFVSHGRITCSTWNWTPGSLLYLGEAGALTATRPETGKIVIVGYALSATLVHVAVQLEVDVSGFAPVNHNHEISGVTGLQSALDLKENKTALKGAAYKDVGTGAGDVAAGDHTQAISTVTGLQAALDLKANLASPEFSGVPTVPTAAAGTNNTQAASTAFVQAGLGSKSPLWGFELTAESKTATPWVVCGVDASANAVDITLPAAPIALDQVKVLDANNSALTNTIRVLTNGHTVNGDTEGITITGNGGCVTVLFNGTAWRIIGGLAGASE